jgi:hypothetical protein
MAHYLIAKLLFYPDKTAAHAAIKLAAQIIPQN